MDLQAEGKANGGELGSVFEKLTAKNGQYCDTLENVVFEDHNAMLKYVEPSADYNTVDNTGIYIGFSDDTYFFANHQKQAADWRPTERGWYSAGKDQETFICTAPYVDAARNELCVTFVRNVNCANAVGELAENATNLAHAVSDLTDNGNSTNDTMIALVNQAKIGQEDMTEVQRSMDNINESMSEMNSAASVMQDMIHMMGEVNDIASSVAAISEEQSASSEEITATIYTLTESANQIASESQGVENVANSVSDSAFAINDELSKFKIESDNPQV